MVRDLELMRKILFKIEDEYKAGERFMYGPKVDGYDTQTIAEHCLLLYQGELINAYEPHVGGGIVMDFRIGNLTSSGYDFLELIKSDEVWEKTKTEIEVKKLPRTIEAIARVAGIFSANFFKELNS
jgi:hypothetical protein